MPLCQVCQHINIHALLSLICAPDGRFQEDECLDDGQAWLGYRVMDNFRHHDKISHVQNAAQAGCEFCTMIWEGYEKLGDEFRDVRDMRKPIYLGREGSEIMASIWNTGIICCGFEVYAKPGEQCLARPCRVYKCSMCFEG